MKDKSTQNCYHEKTKIAMISDEIWKIEDRLMKEILERTKTEWKHSFLTNKLDSQQESEKNILFR